MLHVDCMSIACRLHVAGTGREGKILYSAGPVSHISADAPATMKSEVNPYRGIRVAVTMTRQQPMCGTHPVLPSRILPSL
jgi:hypothetical protein